jgi:hypothetical protein
LAIKGAAGALAGRMPDTATRRERKMLSGIGQMHLANDWTTLITVSVGMLGAVFYVASISMKTVIPLRIAGIVSAVFFLVFGFLVHSFTTIFLYFILVPLNSLRLYQML